VKPKELVLICYYSEEESLSQIIQSSFDSFLKKELKNVEKYLYSIV